MTSGIIRNNQGGGRGYQPKLKADADKPYPAVLGLKTMRYIIVIDFFFHAAILFSFLSFSRIRFYFSFLCYQLLSFHFTGDGCSSRGRGSVYCSGL